MEVIELLDGFWTTDLDLVEVQENFYGQSPDAEAAQLQDAVKLVRKG